MIFIEVVLKAPNEAVLHEMLPTIREAMAATAAEDGCIVYRFTHDIDDPCLLHVTELWESEETLFTHFAGDALKIVMRVLPRMEVLGIKARKGDMVMFDLPLPSDLTGA